MKFTDGKKTIDIVLRMWDDRSSHYEPEWTADFYDVGGLPYDEETNTYTVEDVDYLIEQAEDWKNGAGDYADQDEALEYEQKVGLERCVDVEYID